MSRVHDRPSAALSVRRSPPWRFAVGNPATASLPYGSRRRSLAAHAAGWVNARYALPTRLVPLWPPSHGVFE
eukprot:8163199-Alexandrium_andersonii.AAC.1